MTEIRKIDSTLINIISCFLKSKLKNVKIKEGKLKVDDAEIPHYSKYGWCR